MPLQMRLPKYGFSSRVGRVTAEIRAELNKVEGETVNLDTLRKAGLINASIKRVKVMLSGEVTRKLSVEGVRVSKGAKEAIEKAGGSVAEFVEEKPAKLTKKARLRPPNQQPSNRVNWPGRKAKLNQVTEMANKPNINPENIGAGSAS